MLKGLLEFCAGKAIVKEAPPSHSPLHTSAPHAPRTQPPAQVLEELLESRAGKAIVKEALLALAPVAAAATAPPQPTIPLKGASPTTS